MEPSEILPESESGTTGEKRSSEAVSRLRERELEWLQQNGFSLEERMKKDLDRALGSRPLMGLWRNLLESESGTTGEKRSSEALSRLLEWKVEPIEPTYHFRNAALSRCGDIVREEYPRQVLDILQGTILYQSSSKALYLCGPSGSGKSHCIDVVKSRLEEELKNHNSHPPDIVSVDIFHLHQPSDMYKEVLGSQYHTRELFYQCLDGENGEKMRILIVENLDRCVDNNWQDLLEEILRLTDKSFLLVGLGRNMLDVEFTDVISFPSYGGDELTKIVRQTIEGMEISFKPEAVVFLTDKLQLNHGYLRVLEPICASAVEKDKRKEVELDDIRSACDKIEGVLKNISRKAKPIRSQLLYKTVVTVLYEKRSHVVSLNDLQKTYQRMCKDAKTKPLTDQQIRVMCSRYNSNGGMTVHKDNVHAGPLVLEIITTGLQAEFE